MVQQAKVLVVEGDTVAGRACERVLSQDGHSVSLACTREEALRQIERSDVDVALVDLTAPGPAGFNVVRAIRRVSPKTGVIVITGSPTIDNAKESIRLGVFDYLTKPFVPERIRNVVSLALVCRPWAMERR